MWKRVVAPFEILMVLCGGVNIMLWHRAAAVKSMFFTDHILSHSHKNIHFIPIPTFSPSPPGTQSSVPAWIVHDNVSVTFEKCWKEFRAESQGWILNSLLNCGTSGFFNKTFSPPSKINSLYVQGDYLLVLFTATEISFCSPSNVFHLDFTPEKKTTKIIESFFEGSVFPSLFIFFTKDFTGVQRVQAKVKGQDNVNPVLLPEVKSWTSPEQVFLEQPLELQAERLFTPSIRCSVSVNFLNSCKKGPKVYVFVLLILKNAKNSALVDKEMSICQFLGFTVTEWHRRLLSQLFMCLLPFSQLDLHQLHRHCNLNHHQKQAVGKFKRKSL